MAKRKSIIRYTFIALLIFLFSGCTPRIVKKICINRSCILAEIADSPATRKKGLMYRKSLPEDRGMLFVFAADGFYAFWMKNMRFPLDILWIDRQKMVVQIKEEALPCKDACVLITPAREARYVLEVNAGFLRDKKVKIGDKLIF